MSNDLSPKDFSRRNILKILAGAAVRCPAASASSAGTTTELKAVVRTLPDGTPAMEGAPRFLNVEEFDTLAAISEAIIPTDDHSPGARDAGVPLYIDAVLTESEDEQRIFWKQGLAAVNRLAEKSYGRRFSACAASQQEELLLKISANEESPATPEERFFVAAKRATIDGYYTSEIGIHKDLEYQGNAMLEEFEGCAHAEHGADEKSP